jgi:hypothetical protein
MCSGAPGGDVRRCLLHTTSMAVMKLVLVLLILLALAIAGAVALRARAGGAVPTTNPPNWQPPAADIISEVSVMANGDVFLQGTPIPLDALGDWFATQKAGTEIRYYRENPAGEPHANAMKVLSMIMDQKLSISISSKPDFSDYVDEMGVSHPR